MILANDIARCAGVYAEGWREGCWDCQRRTDPGEGDHIVHMAPPKLIVFECEFRIEPEPKSCA